MQVYLSLALFNDTSADSKSETCAATFCSKGV